MAGRAVRRTVFMRKICMMQIDFINVLDKLKEIPFKLLSMIPLVREFTRLVEEKKDIKAATHYGNTPLGRLLKEYRTPHPRYEKFVIFPEVALWQESKTQGLTAMFIERIKKKMGGAGKK